MDDGVWIATAKRSPIGRLGGALAPLSAAELGSQVISQLIQGSGIDPAALDEVILGQVLQGGAGQNPARQAAMKAGIPREVPAMTINKVCGAGQKSVHLAAQAIRVGDANLILAGGQDSMTRAPHILPDQRLGHKMGDVKVRDTMIVDGLWDAFNDIHMGETVEYVARSRQIGREEQDTFALESQRRAAAAIDGGAFTSELVRVTVTDRRGDHLVTKDEHPRPGTTPEELAAMRPVFAADGTITAGNASGLNDGAAMMLVASGQALRDHGLEPLARVASYASAALDPMEMGLGPVAAARLALRKAGWSPQDPEILEINEAFAAQSIAVIREMGWDPERVNPNGGAIALGHPLAGSGARIVVTLAHAMRARGASKGLAALCIGGGMGVAICLEAA